MKPIEQMTIPELEAELKQWERPIDHEALRGLNCGQQDGICASRDDAIEALTEELAERRDEPKFMAYNHNGIELLKEPARKAAAQAEAREYSSATGNGSYVRYWYPKPSWA